MPLVPVCLIVTCALYVDIKAVWFQVLFLSLPIVWLVFQLVTLKTPVWTSGGYKFWRVLVLYKMLSKTCDLHAFLVVSFTGRLLFGLWIVAIDSTLFTETVSARCKSMCTSSPREPCYSGADKNGLLLEILTYSSCIFAPVKCNSLCSSLFLHNRNILASFWSHLIYSILLVHVKFWGCKPRVIH